MPKSPKWSLCSRFPHRGHVCLLWVLCVVVRWRSLGRAGHSSRGVLPTVMCRCVWSRNLMNEEPHPINCDWAWNRRCVTGCISYMPLIVTVKHDWWMSSPRLQWYWEIKKNFPTKIPVHIFLFSRTSAFCPTHRIPLDLIFQILLPGRLK